MKFRPVVALAALTLAGCQHEDPGMAAARMEQQDDSTCQKQAAGKGAAVYNQCRANLIMYRQQVAVEEQQNAARLNAAAEGLAAAGRAMQSISPPPQSVTVTCIGCR